MQIFRSITELKSSSDHPVVTIGNFDGVHIGHQKIIALAIQQAQARGGQSFALTFKPHPQAALHPQRDIQLLTTYDEKLSIFEDLGIDVAIEEPFNREFSTIEPEEFFNEILLKRLRTECIVVGYDFGFGKNRGGHLEILQELCRSANIDLIVVPPMQLENETVSSSTIRRYLLNGEINAANRLLGRKFSYQGVVSHGDSRGRQIGFPTANLKPANKLLLPFGVYATYSTFEKKNYPSVTNLGIRPTFLAKTNEAILEPWIETHLLDQSLDLYDRPLEVSFVQRLRAEIKFQDLESLKSQIRADVELAKALLKAFDLCEATSS